MDSSFIGTLQVSDKLIFLASILIISLLGNIFWILSHLKFRHEKEKYTSSDTKHPSHSKFRDIKYHIWVLKHLPLKLQPKNVRDHPHAPYTLKDNFLILVFHPTFGALRKVIALWLVFSIMFSSFGIFFLTNTNSAYASSDFSIKTGYFYGSGASQSITGIGFAPEVVIIKSDTAAGQMVWKSSSMATSVSSYLGVATADNTETEITLGADGFTVSAALEVNTVSVRYTYIAYAGSDCTSGGVLCVGSYTGDGAATKTITTGFQPNLIVVKRSTAVVGNFRTSSMSDNHAGFFSATANDTSGVYYTTISSSGFTVGLTNNAASSTYYYLAFKNVANKLTVGSFTGDGVDSRNITGLGFEPDFVFVKQNSAIVPAFNTTEMFGDLSSFPTAAANAVNHIQSLDSDGFQVGSSTSVNALGIVSNYFAFGGSSDPSPSGSFYMQKGSYTGSGTAQSIDTSFAPDLVFIKANSTEYGVWSTKPDTNITHYFANSAVGFAGGITSMGDTSFTVGTHSTTNTNGITYEWVAYGNATSPHSSAKAADFAIGMYTGNGLSPRAIDHLGFAPSMVVIKRAIGVAALTNWRSSAMSADTAEYFSATADITNGTSVQSLDSGGFTLGTGATVNTVNATYIWFAFKEGANFDVGSHTGTGVAKDVTGLGFDPEYVWTKRSTAVSAVHRSTSSTITTTLSQYFLNLSNITNFITAFVTDGFTVGTATEVNANAGAYQYAAWNSTTSASPPATPTNSSPSNAATAQDLNATLTGSDYSDTDGNLQTDSQWQVDDDSDFATPVWTRTAGASGVTTSVTAGNGTFANELSGKTELDHNSTYYFRVRYSDGVYSSWSTATSFTTNTISTPTHSSPANLATVTTLTPTLTASAFSDAQSGHTALNAQWQISTSSSFDSPMYDSGTVSYGASLVVPDATLSDKIVYYWRVRYQDSNSQWSSYSTATRFLVQQSTTTSLAKLTPLFGSNVIDQGDSVKIDAQFLSSTGTPINDATITINIYNPSGTLIVTAQSMSYIASSNGIYRYAYTIPSTSGSYLYDVTATSGSTTGYGAENFEVRTISADLTSARTDIATVNTNVDTVNTNVAAVKAKTDTINWSDVTSIKNATVSITGSVSDASPSESSFKTNLSSSKDDFYLNMVMTFTTGDNSGQTRRISSYSGSDKKISVSPGFSYTPSNGDDFLISVGSVRAEDLAGSAKSTIESVQAKLNTLTGTLPSDYSGMYEQLKAVAASLSSLGVIQGSGADSLYSISATSKDDVKYLKNKLLDLQAALEINKAMLLGGKQSSIFSSWYTFNSVVINMLIANPTDRQAKIPFKAYLPKEAKPENVISSDGMNIEYDEGAQSYFVSGEFELDAKESITKKVEIKDIWQIDETELRSFKTQANDLHKEAQKTSYSAQSLVLKNDVLGKTDKILRKQKDNNATPQEHIQTFRENQDDLAAIKTDIKGMTDLVTSVGASRGLLASVGGIQTISTWGIIIILIAGIAILGGFSYSMWKHQMLVIANLSSEKLNENKKSDINEGFNAAILAEPKNPEIDLGLPKLNSHWSGLLSKIGKLPIFFLLGGIFFLLLKRQNLNLSSILEDSKVTPTTVVTAIPTVKLKPTKKITITQTETGWLNVRDEASINGKILDRVNVGDSFVELASKENDLGEEWKSIKLEDDTIGWILGEYTEVVTEN